MTTTPLTVLDLVPISSGSNAAQALRATTITGPSATLLSRTGTTDVNPGATSRQLPPFASL